MTETQKRARTGRTAESEGFSEEERAAMRERAAELKRASGRSKRSNRAEGEADVLAKIAEMPEADRVLAELLHATVNEVAPDLVPRTWYGMPAYSRDGNIICFFQSAHKFKSRYATLGFTDHANLDQGAMWPTYFALKELTPEVVTGMADLLRQALS